MGHHFKVLKIMNWTVEINYQHSDYAKFISKNHIQNLVEKTCAFLDIKFSGYFLLNIIDVKTMSQINKEHYPFQKTSNILTFSLQKNVKFSNFYNPLGEIFFCLPKVWKQNKNSKKLFLSNALDLFLHSFLHLLGFDHVFAKNQWRMEEFHKNIWKKIKI